MDTGCLRCGDVPEHTAGPQGPHCPGSTVCDRSPGHAANTTQDVSAAPTGSFPHVHQPPCWPPTPPPGNLESTSCPHTGSRSTPRPAAWRSHLPSLPLLSLWGLVHRPPGKPWRSSEHGKEGNQSSVPPPPPKLLGLRERALSSAAPLVEPCSRGGSGLGTAGICVQTTGNTSGAQDGGGQLSLLSTSPWLMWLQAMPNDCRSPPRPFSGNGTTA